MATDIKKPMDEQVGRVSIKEAHARAMKAMNQPRALKADEARTVERYREFRKRRPY